MREQPREIARAELVVEPKRAGRARLGPLRVAVEFPEVEVEPERRVGKGAQRLDGERYRMAPDVGPERIAELEQRIGVGKA